MNVLIDTNVMLDYLIKREPYYKDASEIFFMCASGKLNGCIAAHSVINAFYILRKSLSAEKRRKMLLDLCEITNVIGIDQRDVLSVLNDKGFADMEDCLQSECAAKCGAEYVITRNVKDFVESKVAAIEPRDFISLQNKEF